MSSALYIHIPFCISKCNYCSFNSYAGLESLQERYVESLCVECRKVQAEGQAGPLETIFLGGGTPTLLSTNILIRLITYITTFFEIAHDCEFSIEANPGTLDETKLKSLLTAGVNRLSIGVQSFNNKELETIGRTHSASDAKQAIAMAKAAGFENLSIDLMYGLPSQTPGTWQESLETAIDLDIPHLSLYQLIVEEGTALKKMLRDGKIQLPDEDAIADMDDITASFTEEQGLVQYEISNYARKGFQCRHNINYWENNDYYGIGAGAVGYIEGTRIKNINNPERYCSLLESGHPVAGEKEYLAKEASFGETVIMGLRMNQGVSIKKLQDRYDLHPDQLYGKTLQRLLANNLLEYINNHLCLTTHGRQFANVVMAELV